MLSDVAAAGAMAALLLGGFTADTAVEQAASKMPAVSSVSVVSTNGTGCARGAAASGKAATVKGPNAFTIALPTMSVRTGGSAKIIDRNKFCQFSVKITVPRGYTYTLAEARYSGTTKLPQGAFGTARFSYYWTGQSNTSTHSTRINSSEWQIAETEAKTFEQLGWAPCGESANLNLKTELSVQRGKTGSVTLGGQKDPAEYRLIIKKC